MGDDCVGIPLCQKREAYSKHIAHGGEQLKWKERRKIIREMMLGDRLLDKEL